MYTKPDKLEVYKGKDGEWRWRLKASNGKIIADSAESYVNRGHAIKMAERITKQKALIKQ